MTTITIQDLDNDIVDRCFREVSYGVLCFEKLHPCTDMHVKSHCSGCCNLIHEETRFFHVKKGYFVDRYYGPANCSATDCLKDFRPHLDDLCIGYARGDFLLCHCEEHCEFMNENDNVEQ